MKTLLTTLCFQVLLPHLAFAQEAAVPFKGTGNYYISFQNFYTSDHWSQDGQRLNRGKVQENGLIQEVDFGITDRIGVAVSLPFVFGKYYDGVINGVNFAHQSPGNYWDNGSYHGTLQDFRFSARYVVTTRPLLITPFIQGIIPSHDYEIFSHAAVGFGLREMRLGVTVGRVLSRSSAFQIQYAYGIVQEHLGIRPNRSLVRSQFQYVVPHSNRRLIVSALEGFQWSHAGLNFPADFPVQNYTSELWYRHAQVWKSSFLNFGVSAGFTLNKSGSVEILGNYLTDVWGESAHTLNRGLGIGINYNFRTRWYDEKKSLAAQKESCGVVCRKCQALFRPITRTPSPGR